LLLAASIASLIGVSVWSIIIYNQTVTLSHDISEVENRQRELEAKNAELKNDRYARVDAKELHATAVRYGLIKIEKPEYLEMNQLGSLGANLQN